MKKSFLIFFCLFSFLSFSQTEKKYIMLDSFVFKKYTLNTKKMYGFDGEIEMYNIFIYGGLLLITIFPDLDKNISWEEVSFSFTEDELISFKIDIERQIENQKEPKIFKKYGIIKKENDKYYIAKNTLIEEFFITDVNTSLQISGNNVINTKQKIMTYQDVKKEYTSKFSKYSPMEEYLEGILMVVRIPNFLRAIYLSEIEEKSNEKIYHFWTFDDWRRDGDRLRYPYRERDYNYHRGIDRFAYIKDKGIVAGSYDFYFNEQAPYGFKRVVRYDKMWAIELFPERQ